MSALMASGCGGSGESEVERKYEPAEAAAKAIEHYDRDGDGKLSAEELKGSPALAESGRRLDQDGDRIVTREEMQTRFEELEGMSDLVAVDLQVTSQRRPLAGAEVTLTPESFMGEGLQTYSGTTNDGGGTSLTGSTVQLPGLPSGFYQAKIVHAGQGIDAVRGVEIADDVGNRVQIAL